MFKLGGNVFVKGVEGAKRGVVMRCMKFVSLG